MFYAAVWWLLTSGTADSWAVGLFIVPCAAWASVSLCNSAASIRSTSSLSLLRLLPFIPYFLLHSLRGGWATARLALQPALLVEPGFINYRMQLSCESARLFLLHVVSLLPGTVSVSLQGSNMRVHALVLSSVSESELAECERRVARLFKQNDPDSAAHAESKA